MFESLVTLAYLMRGVVTLVTLVDLNVGNGLGELYNAVTLVTIKIRGKKVVTLVTPVSLKCLDFMP